MEICLPGREIIAMPYTNAHQWQQIDSIYLWVMPVLCTVLEEPQVSLMIVNVTRTIKLPVLKCRLDEARFFSGHKDSEFLPQDNDLQVLRAKVTFSLLCLRWKCGDREWNLWKQSACFTTDYHNHSFSREEKYSETKPSTTEILTLLLQCVFQDAQ